MNELSLDQQLCFALYKASRAATAVYRPLLTELGITYPQYLVLHVLWEDDGRSIGAIAQRLSLEPSTVTPLVKRLEAAGFLTRTRRPDDERSVRVALTDKGRALRKESRCLGETLLARGGMTLSDMLKLKRQAQALTKALSGVEES